MRFLDVDESLTIIRNPIIPTLCRPRRVRSCFFFIFVSPLLSLLLRSTHGGGFFPYQSSGQVITGVVHRHPQVPLLILCRA